MPTPLLLSVVLVAAVSADTTTWDINSPGCGINHIGYKYPSHYIVGGEDAEAHAYPWMVAMYYRGSFRCGGSYILGDNGNAYVLTAAHCTVNTNVTQWEMRLGRHELDKEETNVRQHMGINLIINHEGYDSTSYDWDISLLRLETLPTATDFVSHGCIPVGDKKVNVTAAVTGWGALSEGGVSSNMLQVVEKPILSDAICKAQLGSNNYHDNNMLCAGYNDGGSDACQGDSGGPLFNAEGQKKEIAGIVSWGFGCARPERPGVYHNVFKSKSWIDNKINQN